MPVNGLSVFDPGMDVGGLADTSADRGQPAPRRRSAVLAPVAEVDLVSAYAIDELTPALRSIAGRRMCRHAFSGGAALPGDEERTATGHATSRSI